MKKVLLLVLGTGLLTLGASLPASAGTQDFTLVNKTGVTINNLYISESTKDDWEEDVLGEDQLASGESMTITFSGHESCTWDLMVKDEDGEGVFWRGIDLCETAKVILTCDKEKCWAELE